MGYSYGPTVKPYLWRTRLESDFRMSQHSKTLFFHQVYSPDHHAGLLLSAFVFRPRTADLGIER